MASNVDSDLLKLYLEIAGNAYGSSFPSDVPSPNVLSL